MNGLVSTTFTLEKKTGFKLERNKDLTCIVIIVDIDWYEKNYRDNFWGHIAQPYDSVFQFLPISSNFAQALKRSGPTFHSPQSTTWSALCEGDVLHCMRQMVVTDTDPPHTVKLHILEWPFIVVSLRYSCTIIMLSNQHLDMPHLWGGWIISAKKCSLTQI